jgi:hypothetical protein
MVITVKSLTDVNLPTPPKPLEPEWPILEIKKYIRGLVGAISDYLHEHGQTLENIAATVTKDIKLVLYPEFQGATLAAPEGGANSGVLITDSELVGDYYYNYYKWYSEEVTLQNYAIILQVRIPESFKEFLLNALTIDICTKEVGTLNNKIDVYVYKEGAVTGGVSTSLLNSSLVAETWYSERAGNALITFLNSDANISEIEAGDTLDIIIVLSSKNSAYTKIGAVTLQYVG